MGNKKIVIAVGGGVVVLVIVVFMVVLSGSTSVAPTNIPSQPVLEENSQPSPTPTPTPVVPSPTPTPSTEAGSIDDVVAEILQESSEEETLAQEEEGDAGALSDDEAALGDFGQSADGTNF